MSAAKVMEKIEDLRTPITAETNWFMSGAGGRCDFFEKQWINCASKLGRTRAEKDCSLIKADLKECAEMPIAIKRYNRMQEERQKKGLPYQVPPPYDTVAYERFKNHVF